jgi:hypothetical protein
VVEYDESELLLSLDGARFEAAEGYVVEFTAKRTRRTAAHPHGLRYSLVFRPDRGKPLVGFDNAHGVKRPGGKFVAAAIAHDHWHRAADDPGRPYPFTTAEQLIDDFWREVKRAMTRYGISNDL